MDVHPCILFVRNTSKLLNKFYFIARFTGLVRQFGMRLPKSLLEEIMKAFAGEKNTVDQELLKSVYMTQYPDTRPPPERPVKKKKDKGKRPKKGKAKTKEKKK